MERKSPAYRSVCLGHGAGLSWVRALSSCTAIVRFGSITDISTFLHPQSYVPMWLQENHMHEPQPTPHPRPCSTPHSAPAAWLKTPPEQVQRYDPQIEPPANTASEPVAPEPLT